MEINYEEYLESKYREVKAEYGATSNLAKFYGELWVAELHRKESIAMVNRKGHEIID